MDSILWSHQPLVNFNAITFEIIFLGGDEIIFLGGDASGHLMPLFLT